MILRDRRGKETAHLSLQQSHERRFRFFQPLPQRPTLHLRDPRRIDILLPFLPNILLRVSTSKVLLEADETLGVAVGILALRREERKKKVSDLSSRRDSKSLATLTKKMSRTYLPLLLLAVPTRVDDVVLSASGEVGFVGSRDERKGEKSDTVGVESSMSRRSEGTSWRRGRKRVSPGRMLQG